MFFDVSFFINVKSVNKIVIIHSAILTLYSNEFKKTIKSGEGECSYSVLSNGKLKSE